MMNGDNKRKIDAARDVLVGIIPDPKGQVEQITTALIYKYIDELDRRALKMSGKRSFFTGQYTKFSWEKLMLPHHEGHQRLTLYREALEKLPQNKKLPLVFCDMLRGAYSQFNDPSKLYMFMQAIDELQCANTEDLGNAYEHLLSIMGTQKKAGQFRTPRHIIEFIVAIVAPQKSNSILDPACGSAGFLVSAYNYIIDKNARGDNLTSREKQKLTSSIVGRDIDSGMIRLALVNLYLHGIKDPRAEEYDTLSDDTLWDEQYDVILANPPFMTPKGGIRPHDKFLIPSNRTEFLFMDYIAEHLSLQGKAGIIMPEGIVSDSKNIPTRLRKELVEEWGLYAVISLPSGVFAPYTNKKTSVLLIDRTRKHYQNILFVKIKNDGFELDTKRKPISKNDIPHALEIFRTWQDHKMANTLALAISKKRIAKNKIFSLDGDKYRRVKIRQSDKHRLVKLKDVCKFIPGEKVKASTHEYVEIGDIDIDDKSYDVSQKTKTTVKGAVRVPKNTILISTVRPTRGAVALTQSDINVSSAFCCLQYKNKFVFYMICDEHFLSFLRTRQVENTYPVCKNEDIMDYQIPFPPLEKQESIAAEIENYKKVGNSARAVIKNWKPVIDIDPNWELVKLGDQIENVKHTNKIQKSNYSNKGEYPIIDQSKNFIAGYWRNKKDVYFVTKPLIVFGDHTKCFKYVDFNFVLGADGTKLLLPKPNFNPKFFYYVCKNLQLKDLGYARHYTVLKDAMIPCPSLAEQGKIVADIEMEEEATVQKCGSLADRMEQKINAIIKKVWEK